MSSLVDGFTADLVPVDFRAPGVPQEGSEGDAANVLGGRDQVDDRGLRYRRRHVGGQRVNDVLPVTVERFTLSSPGNMSLINKYHRLITAIKKYPLNRHHLPAFKSSVTKKPT